MSIAEDLFFNIYPPTATTIDPAHAVLSTATSGSAANYAWADAIAATAAGKVKGSVMLTLEASTEDVYVRFKPAAEHTTVAAAATTVTNGLIVKADQPGRTWKVNPLLHGVIDHIATGVGTLQVQVSSHIGERNII